MAPFQIKNIYSFESNEINGKAATKQFMYVSSAAVTEFPIEVFSQWYKDLQFGSKIDAINEEGWVLKVVVVCPNSRPIRPANVKKRMQKIAKAKKRLLQFYSNSFNYSTDDKRSIRQCINHDLSIMILAKKRKEGEKQPRNLLESTGTDVVVVGAVTFVSTAKNTPAASPVFISWLAIAVPETPAPVVLTGWRRNGFGLFLLIHVIKLCCVQGDSTTWKNVDLYLQCTEEAAFNFYSACGFRQINDDNDPGEAQLPDALKFVMMAGSQPFITRDYRGVPKLLCLRSGGLQKLSYPAEMPAVEEVIDDGDVQATDNDFVYCRFPRVSNGNTFASLDMDACMQNLNIFNNLLPGASTNNLILLQPVHTRYIHGEMMSSSRLKNDTTNGEEWISLGELHLFLAFLLRDGRYNESVFVVPIPDVQRISAAFQAQEAYVKAKNRDGAVDIQHLEELKRKFDSSVRAVIENVIQPNPGLLQKQCILFIACIDDHWRSVFVFNASSIIAGTSKGKTGLRCCHYSYNSFNPLGDDPAPHSMGIVWFLNLAFSHQEKSMNPVVSSQEKPSVFLLHPFGTPSMDEDMLGSDTFPALLFDEKDHFPIQLDVHSCGIAVPFMAGIIFRDLIGTPALSHFDTLFAVGNLPVATRESFDVEHQTCLFPTGVVTFPGASSPNISIFHDTKMEFFIAIDRLAEYRHNFIPSTMDANWKMPSAYLQMRKKLRWPPKLAPPRSASPVISQGAAESAAGSLLQLLNNPTASSMEASIAASSPEVLAIPDPEPAMRKRKRGKPGGKKKKLAIVRRRTKALPSAEDVNENSSLPVVTEPSEMQTSVPDPTNTHSIIQEGADDESPETAEEVRMVTQELTSEDPTEAATNTPAVTSDPTEDSTNTPAVAPATSATKRRKKPPPRILPDAPDIEEIRERYGWSPTKNKPPRLDVTDMERFVAQSFASWEWSTKEEFQQQVRDFRNEGKSALFIKKMKQERQFFVRKLQAEYKFTRPAMLRGLKYSKRKNAFTARVVYIAKDVNTGALESKEEDMFVEEDWVREELDQEIVNHIMNRSGGFGFTKVPAGKEVSFSKSPVVRIRYIPPRERTIIDAEECRRVDMMDHRTKLDVIRKQLGRNGMSLLEIKTLQVEELLKMIPDAFRKTVHVAASWTALLANKKETRVEEPFVRRNFGDVFTDELIRTRTGFVDVPVGDFKESNIQEYPELLDTNAPLLRYRQFQGMDQCVTKSFASALHAMNFITEAKAINEFGEKEISGGTALILWRTLSEAKVVLPNWIQGRRIDGNYDWKGCLVDRRLILVGALVASDGNINHAITIHGGYIYDANEKAAIPLSQEGLDYCTSTPTTKSHFIAFRTVLLFQYKGTKKSRLEQMTRTDTK